MGRLMIPTTIVESLWGSFEKSENGCWLWTGLCIPTGYASFNRGGGNFAHRTMYELVVGPIPEGQHLDHLCHTNDPSCPGGITCLHRRCINPTHLEAVTSAENTARAISRRVGFLCGHPKTPENSYANGGGSVRCRLCKLTMEREAYVRKTALV